MLGYCYFCDCGYY